MLTNNLKNFSTSKYLIKNVKNFIHMQQYTFLDSFYNKSGVFYGWGRKKSGLNTVRLAKKYHTSFVLLEDGFIRSLGLAVDGSPSFSIVEDDVGIYYDASSPSKLENILNEYDFKNDTKLMNDARDAIDLVVKHNISKYNNAKNIDENYFKTDEDRVLVIAQTRGDSSLEYGMLNNFTTDDMLNAAMGENPKSKVYLKIHPDVLSGKKKSDIDIESVRNKCTIIEEDVNPLSLLEHFSKVYTKTSGMGFEALLVGCECVCFGMPFYAGWGVTTDKSLCPRRKAKRSVEEIFAAAYILYTRYHNPYTNKTSDIFNTIETILRMRGI